MHRSLPSLSLTFTPVSTIDKVTNKRLCKIKLDRPKLKRGTVTETMLIKRRGVILYVISTS